MTIPVAMYQAAIDMLNEAISRELTARGEVAALRTELAQARAALDERLKPEVVESTTPMVDNPLGLTAKERAVSVGTGLR